MKERILDRSDTIVGFVEVSMCTKTIVDFTILSED